MADEYKAKFAVQLMDETSAPAKDAEHALEQLRAKIAEETAAMRGAQSAMARLKSAGLQTSSAAATLRKQIEAHKLVVGQAEAKFVKLGGSFRESSTSAADLAKKVKGARGEFGPLNGSFDATVGWASQAAKATSGLKEQVTALAKPTADVAKTSEDAAAGSTLLRTVMGGVAAAALAVAAAIGAALVAMARYALSVVDARRSELLHIQGLLALRRAHGYATTSANEVQSAIDRVADSTGLARNELSSYAMQIARSGVRGEQFNSILETTAMVASAAGDAAAQTFREQATWAARAGQSVEGLAQRWRNRFGAIATAQSLSFDRQLTRLHENISQLFSGLNINGFLNGFHRIVSIFSQSQESGRALKTLLNGIFGPLLGSTEGWGRTLETVIKRGIIFALRIHIAFMRFLIAFRSFSATRFAHGIVNAARMVLDSILEIPRTIIAVIGSVFGLLGDTVSSLWNAINDFAHWFDGLVDVFRNGSWTDIGRYVVDGIINGLTAQAHRVRDNLTNFARSLTTSFRDALGIHSPSRVFANLGLQIPRGVEQGIERGRGAVNEAASELVDAPQVARVSRTESRSVTSVGDIHITVHAGDVKDENKLAQRIREELESILEGVGIHLGAEPAR